MASSFPSSIESSGGNDEQLREGFNSISFFYLGYQ